MKSEVLDVTKSLLLEIAKVKSATKQLKLWNDLKSKNEMTVRAARSRGKYTRHFHDFSLSSGNGENLKIILRWKENNHLSNNRSALQLASKLITHALKNVNHGVPPSLRATSLHGPPML
jgi:hypothetical protein